MRLRKLLSRFMGEDRAMAAVEFALILPAMLFMYIGTAETSRLFILDRKVAVVAGSIGDLVARADGSLPAATLNDFFQAAEFTMEPYPSGDLEQVVSSLFVENDGTGTVQWSRAYNGGTTHAAGTSITLPAELSQRLQGRFLIMGEAETRWTPIVDFIFSSGFDIEKTFYYRPRFDAAINIT